ncbi:MAG TPA: hypothetical protein DDW52_05145 [Planctomycetaceae bacterium]|nr:hypothetical protein [Planctomycetaceae bacterium]
MANDLERFLDRAAQRLSEQARQAAQAEEAFEARRLSARKERSMQNSFDGDDEEIVAELAENRLERSADSSSSQETQVQSGAAGSSALAARLHNPETLQNAFIAGIIFDRKVR